MMKKTLILNTAALFAATSLVAGPKGTIIDPGPEPYTPASDELGFELSAGYDTTYIFRGFDFGDHLVWVGLDWETEVAQDLTLGLGAWYGSLAEDPYTELTLDAGLSYSLGAVTLGAGYTHYFFLQDNEDVPEVGGTLGFEAGVLDIELGYFYDFEVEGSYLELAIGAEFALTDRVALAPGAAVAYNFDYYASGSDWNHIGVSLGLPITLTSTATLTPYVAANFPLDAITDQSDIVYGGVSLSVSF